MNPIRSCCSPTYDYKKIGRDDSLEHSSSSSSNTGGDINDNMKVPFRQGEDRGAEGRDVVLRIDAESQSNVNGVPQKKRNGGNEGGGIWRGSSYDFLGEFDKKGAALDQSDVEGGSEDKSRSFDFRDGKDPTSKLIGDFLEREKLAGQKSLDMDFDMMDELRGTPENESVGRRRAQLSSVPEIPATERERMSTSSPLHSETSSPQRGVLKSTPSQGPSHPLGAPSPSTSMNARSPLASPPRVQFESQAFSPVNSSSRVQIGSPVHEGGPRYRSREEELVPDNSNRGIPVGSGRKKDGVDETEVLKCSGRMSPNVNIMRTKTRSRLIDPPPPPQYEIKGEEACYASKRRSGQLRSGQLRSGQLKSGMIMKSGMIGKGGGILEKLTEDEEDDPFKDDDIPDEFRRGTCGFLAILQWISFFVILGAFVCSLTIKYFSRKTVWDMHLWKWCLLVLVLFCGRLLSGWVIRIVVFFIERNFLLRKRVLYFVYGLRKAVQNCLWLGLVLLAWHFLFDKKVEKETKSNSLRYVNKVLVCLLVGTLIWLVKTLLVKVLASSFHVSTYFDRIQDSLFNQYVLETLSGPPLIELEEEFREEEKLKNEEEKLRNEVARLKEAGATLPIELKSASRSGLLQKGTMTPRSGISPRSGMLAKSGIIGRSGNSLGVRSGGKEDQNNNKQDEGITIDHLHKLNQKNISAWNMKRLMNIIRHGVLSTLDESFQDAAQEDESATQIRSEWEARAAAKKIFKNVAQPRAKFITFEDLMRFLREDEAMKAMTLFEGAQENNNRVSKSSLKNWVVNVFRERRALALTLNDTKTAVNKLHRMVDVVVGIIIIVIWLLILGIATTHILVLISSQVLLVVFVFGNTCKTVFESIVFLFVMHPFDVGDRCSIEGVQMVVEEMNILTTVFLRYDNEKIWYPNAILATKPISNFYRSPDMGDAIDFQIHIATPVEKVSIMKERIKKYVDNKPEHWYPNPMVVVKDIEDMNKMKMAVWLQHKMNHQDMGEKWLRRSHLVEEMINIFRDLDIEYRLVPCDVNVRQMPAVTSTRLPSTWM